MALAAFGGLLYFGRPNRSSTAYQQTPPTDVTTYVSPKEKFEISYPNRFVTVATTDHRKLVSDASYPGTAKLADFIGIYIPQSEFPKTNFSEAEVDVYAMTNTSCDPQDFVMDNQAPIVPVTINGRTFQMGEITGAGAGNRYDTIFYQTKVGATCYAMTATTHTTVLENYDPALGVKEFDSDRLAALLMSIVNSFMIKA